MQLSVYKIFPGVFFSFIVAFAGIYLSNLIGSEVLQFSKSPVSPIMLSIIIGLITELYISNKLNDFSLDTVDKLKEVSLNYFSRISLTQSDLKGIYDLMIFDKKNDKGSVNFVLLDKSGTAIIDQKVGYDIFIEAFAYYNQ